MNTSTQVIDPNDPRLTEIPLRIFEHRAPSTPEEKYFVAIGLPAIAQRLADVSLQWKCYRVDESNDDTWRKQKFSSMLRSDPRHAYLLEKRHEVQYSPFGAYIQSFGTRLDFRFHADAMTFQSDTHRKLRKLVKVIRALIWHELPRSISKIGCCEDKYGRYNRMMKVLASFAVDSALLARIQKFLPAEVSVTRRVFAKSDFGAELLDWCKMDLPVHWKDRANFELLLHGLHQTEAHHFEMWERRQFALEPKTVKTLNAILPTTFEDLETMLLPNPAEVARIRPPRSPKTGRLARWVSVTVDRDTQPEDLHPSEWLEIIPPS